MNKKLKEYEIKFNKIIKTIQILGIFIFALGVLISIEEHIRKKNKPIEDVQMISTGDEVNTFTKDLGDILINPGKGFIRYQTIYNNQYDDIVSVGYRRYYWSDIEPEKGVYNWKIIDDAIESYSKVNKKFAFGIYNASSTAKESYITPKWVFDSGATGNWYQLENGNFQMIPNWLDEKFLEEMNNFIQELGKRYDGDSNIAFIDIRSYGNWGEQHVIGLGGDEISSEQLEKFYIEPYKNSFSKTLLVNVWGGIRYQSLYEKYIDKGISLRRDGIFKTSNGWECNLAYGKLPTIYEYVQPYSWLKANGYWSADDLVTFVENGKPSYLQFDENMYKENKQLYKYLANKMGYYFKFKGAQYKNTIKTTEQNEIKLTFMNEGVAPLYEPCTVYIGLLNQEYNLVKKYKTDIDSHMWMPNDEKKENINIQFNGVDTGEYIIALGLFYNENDENPTYLLGNTGKTDEKWYVFGKINITYPEEEYIIKDENIENSIKEAEEYKVSLNIKNLRKNEKYNIKLYINGNLEQVINVDSNEENYSDEIRFKLNEEKNNYKIQIEKNDKVVAELTKDVYVTDYIQNYILRNPVKIEYSTTQLTNQPVTAMLKTNGVITVTNNQNSKIHTFAENGEFTFEYTMKGQSFSKKATVTNIDKIAPTITGIENEGFYTGDVTPKVTDINLKEVKLYKNSNQVQNYSVNSTISEDGTYKIVATDKAGNETKVDFYICETPATITYSETNITNKDVTATIRSNYDIQVTNNSGNKTYTFSSNGSFTFDYKIKGKEFTRTATVINIDKKSPTITGVEDGKLYIDQTVTPKATDEHIKDVKLYLNSVEVNNYKPGEIISKEGFYKIVATDTAGNSTTVNFNLMKNNSKEYKIQGKYILNITSNTKKTDFIKKFNDTSQYQITRKGKALTNNDIIATGDVLKSNNGGEYTLIVTGDVNKDGEVDVVDIVKLRRYLLLRNNLDEAALRAADCNLDGESLSVTDLVKLRLIVLLKGST